jgi:hypothetical protein
MPSTKAYLAVLVVLSVVATVFATLWLTTYMNYEHLNHKYRYLLTSLGAILESDTLPPEYYVARVIYIPKGYTGDVIMTIVSKPNRVKVYILDLQQFGDWCTSRSPSLSSYYLYDEGTYINRQVRLMSGVYFVVFINLNTSPTTISYAIATVYTSLND